jgi:hypothetical protein
MTSAKGTQFGAREVANIAKTRACLGLIAPLNHHAGQHVALCSIVPTSPYRTHCGPKKRPCDEVANDRPDYLFDYAEENGRGGEI